MSKTVIPVSCIEQGRWHWRLRRFETANRTLYASARAEQMAQVSHSMRFEESCRSDQSAIWDSIDRKAANIETRSPTGFASDIYETRRAKLDEMVTQVTPQADQVGAAYWVRGRLIGAEIFGSAPNCASRNVTSSVPPWCTTAKACTCRRLLEGPDSLPPCPPVTR